MLSNIKFSWIVFFCVLTQYGQSQELAPVPLEKNAATPVLDSLAVRPLKGLLYQVEGLKFNTGATAPAKGTTNWLDDFAETLASLPSSLLFEIGGHTDNTGSASTNKSISEKRAQSVYHYLRERGIPEEQMTYKGYGPEKPITSNATTSGRLRNRRVEIVFTGLDYNQKNIISLIGSKKIETPFVYLRERENSNILILRNEEEPLEEIPYDQVLTITFSDGRFLELNTEEKEEPQQIEEPQPEPIREEVEELSRDKRQRSGKPFAFSLYGEGLYVLQDLSPGWTDIENGPGILQGVGAGLAFDYYLAKRISVTLQAGYSQWLVERRYISPEAQNALQYTSSEKLTRIPVQAGFRIFATPNIYLQAIGGAQLLKRVTETSELHPDLANTTTTTGTQLMGTGAIGFQKYMGGFFFDIAAQYQMVFNKSFTEVTDPLHVAGLKIGIGFKSGR